MDTLKRKVGGSCVLPELGKQGERWQLGSLRGLSSAESWDDGGDDAELGGRQTGAAGLPL